MNTIKTLFTALVIFAPFMLVAAFGFEMGREIHILAK
jgi:hypothetical protein